MEKVFKGILTHKKSVVILFTMAVIAALILSKTVVVDYDMMDYLPDDASSTKALQVMQVEYGGGIPCAQIMVPNVTIPKALEIKGKINVVDGVTGVTWLDDAVNLTVPIETQDIATVEHYYKNGNALFTVTIDNDKRISAINEMR
jgi:predicted RND superfamily exporter protein